MARTGYVRRQRLHQGLTPLGFRYGRHTGAIYDFNFIRRSEVVGLWECIDVGFMGKKRENAWIDVHAQATSRMLGDRFGVRKYLGDLEDREENNLRA